MAEYIVSETAYPLATRQAIWRADGYIYDDIKERVNEVHQRYWNDRNKN